MTIATGQIWENGKTAVKIQDAGEDLYDVVTFDVISKDPSCVRLSKVNTLDKESTQRYVQRLGCTLTNKILSAV